MKTEPLPESAATEKDAIVRALTFHQTLGYGPEEQICACDRKWRTHLAHRKHLADAIYLAVRSRPDSRGSDA